MENPITATARTGRSAPHALGMRVALLAALVAGGALVLAPGCETVPGEACVGGYVTPEGGCEAKCTADKCLADNTCVENECVLECDAHTDCYPDGTQDCVEATEDGSGASVQICEAAGRSAGTGTPCPIGFECANWLTCPDAGTCFASQCAGDPGACVPDADFCKGDPACLVGKCPDESPCRVNCAVDCHPWLECESSGEGDAAAYCTMRDCQSDDDCIGGYYCGVVRDPHELCGSDPKKGNNNFCGKTTDACLSPGANGTSLFEGSTCLLRRSCLRRDDSVACASDLDCSQVDGQKCVSLAGESRCARTCAQSSDCLADATCDPGLGACVPKFGSWVGAGGGFCEPCKNDEDCGSAGSSWACASLDAGMRGCLDLSFPDTCTSDADCPTSPSGKPGTCLSESHGLGPGDTLYHHCYLPLNVTTNKVSCW